MYVYMNVCFHGYALEAVLLSVNIFFFSVHSDVRVDLLVHLKGSLLTLAPHSVRAASPESDAFQSLGTTCETQRCTE